MGDVGAQEYECRGGPRDGAWRAAKDGSRFYVLVRQTPDEDPLAAVTIESNVPTPGPAWLASGWYELTRIMHRRFGARTVWQWHTMTAWPLWLSEPVKPFQPEPTTPFEPPKLPPPSDFRSDKDG